MSRKRAGSSGPSETTKASSGCASPCPVALMKASFRVQQRKKAAGRSASGNASSTARSRGANDRAASAARSGSGRYCFHVDADGAIPAHRDHRDVARVGQVEAQGRAIAVERGLAVRPVGEGHTVRRQAEVSAQHRAQRAARHHEAPSVAVELEAAGPLPFVPGQARGEPRHRAGGDGEIDVPEVNVTGPERRQAGDGGARSDGDLPADLAAGARILVVHHAPRRHLTSSPYSSFNTRSLRW